MRALLAAVAAFLASGAIAADPYPDQRGLSAAELEAATATMRAVPANAKMPLVASGKRDGDAYVVFAAPAEQPAPILGIQRRVLCTSAGGAPWRCSPQVFYRFKQGRLVQSFAYQAKGVAEDPVIAFKVVGYFAQCIDAQYAAKTGRRLPGGMPAIAEVVQDAKGVTVSANAGNTFELAETKPEPGQACAFTLQTGRVAASPEVASAAQAPEQAQEPAPSASAPAQPAAAAPVSGLRHLLERIAGVAIGMNLIAAALALLIPFYARRKRGRRAAAMNATLAAAATVAFAILVVVLLKLAGVHEAGARLRLVVPATLAALASAIVWGVIGAAAQRAAERPKKAAA